MRDGLGQHISSGKRRTGGNGGKLIIRTLLLTWCVLAAGSAVAVEHRADHLPRLLSDTDTRLYQEVFGLQQQGKMTVAAQRISQLSDRRLMGHVLFQRYMHPTSYRSQYSELKDWLEHYGDHPGADRIYRLALRRRPGGADAPPMPARWRNRASGEKRAQIYRSPVWRSDERAREVNWAKRRIRTYVRRGQPTNALKFLQRDEVDRLLDAVETDMARQEIAKGYFLAGLDGKALPLAQLAADRSGTQAPQSHWYAGLAAWRSGKAEQAAHHFSAVADAASPYASAQEKSAAAYWAARAFLKTAEPQSVTRYLRLAARYPRTLYGILAHRQLGWELPFNWRVPPLTAENLAWAGQQTAINRMIALVEAGQAHLADQEMRLLHGRVSPEADEALVALAIALRLPASQMRMAAAIEDRGGPAMAASYPLPSWQPEGGFTLDPALIYAFMRQESRFMAHAKSRSGARGLMQLMPATASFIGNDSSLRHSGRHRLYDPQFNVTLGQRYIGYLLSEPEHHGDLFALAAAYNGGPGNLRRWRRQISHQDDPLLFIETIPKAETRDFIRQIATNYWIYQDRLGQGQHTLDAVAQGRWPTYVQQQDVQQRGVQEQGSPGKQAHATPHCSKEFRPCPNSMKLAHSSR